MEEIQAGRWQRRHAPDAGAPTDEAGMLLFVSESYQDTNATKARCYFLPPMHRETEVNKKTTAWQLPPWTTSNTM